MRPEARWATPAAALALIAALTLGRVVALWFDRTGLYTDESQYWLWGQEMAFGAFSKPPLIGWIIRGATEAFGDTVFAARLAAPLIHGLTAVLVLALGLRVAGERVAALGAMTYATLPAVALGSALMSTDTPMMACAAAALICQHELARRGRDWSRSPNIALLLGLAVGLGLLAKYSMLFVVAGMVLAAALNRDWRIRLADLIVAALVAAAVIAPNLWWVQAHDFVTARHVAEDAEWQGVVLHPVQAARYLAEQFAVMGPLAFAAFGVAVLRPGLMPGAARGLVWATLPVLLIVTGQALASRALANWGVAFTVAGSLVAAAALVRVPRLAALSLALGLAVSLALPAAKIWGTAWRLPNGDLALARYLGRDAVSDRALAFARAQGAGVIVAGDRDLLADLSWQARGSIAVRALPHDGAPRHHWDLIYRYDPAETPGPVALLTRGPAPACAAGLAPLTQESWIAGPGFAEGQGFTLTLVPQILVPQILVPQTCLTP